MRKWILLLVIVSILAAGGYWAYNFAAKFKPPELREISNTWGDVSRRSTEINTKVVIYNPNDISIPIKRIEYELYMNGIRMAEGRSQENIVIRGNNVTTIRLKTVLNNLLLPRWWASHINNGEHTEVRVKGKVVFNLKFREFAYPFEETQEIDTDILGGG
jgi:LEA14-like dessication related protein